jgi:3-hydroxyisobutyrate dehydrogenase-like beta-hydroxyacid dehydrogenase
VDPVAVNDSRAETVGLIGLGLLGSALAERLLASGFDVLGFDTSAERCREFQKLGGSLAASAGEVAGRANRLLLSLPTSEIASQVVAEILPQLPSGAIVVDTTTGEPEQMIALAESLSRAGVNYLDATVGGSSQQARERDVIAIVGGEATTVDACRDLLETFARDTFHVGPVGSGARMKLVVNLVLGLNRAVLAEGLSFARASGFDPNDALQILAAGPAYSRAMDMKGRKMLDEEFAPQARLSQHLKDVRLILAAGTSSGAKLPLSEVHRKLLETAESAGYGDADNSAVIKAYD